MYGTTSMILIPRLCQTFCAVPAVIALQMVLYKKSGTLYSLRTDKRMLPGRYGGVSTSITICILLIANIEIIQL